MNILVKLVKMNFRGFAVRESVQMGKDEGIHKSDEEVFSFSFYQRGF